MRCAIYARFSTDHQSEASIADQLRSCGRVAEVNGFTVSAVFDDRGISAGTTERPGYQRLLEAGRRGEYDIIIVEDISRLWRSRAEYGPRSAELEDAGIHMVTCVGDDTRRDGWGLVLGIKQAIAEAYRKEVSYRTKRGLEGLALAGKSTGGRVYGYRPQGGVHAFQGQAVKAMYDWAAAGFSLQNIVDKLIEEGVPTPRKAPWNRATVRNILTNPRYTGAVTWGATVSRGGARDSRRKTRVVCSTPTVSRQDESLRIISDELFTKVQNRPKMTGAPKETASCNP